MRKIHVIGINSVDFYQLPLKQQSLFKKVSNIAVPESYIEEIKVWAKDFPELEKSFFSSKSNQSLMNWLKNQNEDVILISRGDPLWFGIGRLLLENFSEDELIFYPGNTSIQLAFSKLKRPWQKSIFVSIHGRDCSKLIEELKKRPENIAIITDYKKGTIEQVKNCLFDLDLVDFYDFWLCEDLGLDRENIRKLNLYQTLPDQVSSLNIVILLKKEPQIKTNDNLLFGLPDKTYKTFDDRPNLLTKREIRIQILADLELPEYGIIWDIGAGSGSIGLEAIKLRPGLKLISIDQRTGTKNLILENAKRLQVKPFDVIEDNIIDFIKKSNFKDNLIIPERIILGGGNLEEKKEIIKELSVLLTKDNVIVIPLITLDNLKEILETLKLANFKSSLNMIQTYRGLKISDGMRFEPNNPVFILKGKK